MKAVKLPSKKAVIDLAKSNQRVTDYAKATPTNVTSEYSPLVQTLKKPRA
jgi:hypothetical protein